jgi:OOP family OmpA-OmpF porin
MKLKTVGCLNVKKFGGVAMFQWAVFLLIVGMAMPASTQAAEILTEEDFIKKVVMEDQFVKTADNFLILFDASDSMKRQYKKGAPESRYEVARNVLKQKLAQLPDLGYNSGLYLYTPYKELYPMGPFDKGRFAQAVDSLPAEPKGPTFLPQALRKIEPQLQGLSGKTIVYIFSDGTYSQLGQFKDPEDLTQELADKYNVCFYMIGAPQDNRAEKRLVDMAKANACSRVVPFNKFVENPEYMTGALYVVKATEKIETTTETRIVGLKADNVLFDFNESAIRPEFNDEIDALGEFLLKNPAAYVMLVGYADSIGSEEYNLGLSQRRAESVAAYLENNHSIARDRIVLNWYGEANPIAGNDTDEGRAQNRRVEMAVGGM